MKKLISILLVLAMIFALTACGYNRQIIDLDYKFNYAIIFLPDGSRIEGKVSSWKDFEQSDMIQLKIDGITYLTHSSNVILEER